MTIINALPTDTDPGLLPNFPGQGIDGVTRKYSAAQIVEAGGAVSQSDITALQATVATLQAAVAALQAAGSTFG